ncbi:hypothetical protein [Azospirillum sp. sgz302134]
MTRAAHPSTDSLDRSYDGAPPREILRLAMLGGRERHDTRARAAVQRLHGQLAAEARLGAARRRAALPASGAPTDSWLTRLSATLAHHRHAARAIADSV